MIIASTPSPPITAKCSPGPPSTVTLIKSMSRVCSLNATLSASVFRQRDVEVARQQVSGADRHYGHRDS